MPVLIPGYVDVTNVLSIAYYVAYSIAPPLLVWFVLRANGGLGAIGLSRRGIARDVLIGCPLLVAAYIANHVGTYVPNADIGGFGFLSPGPTFSFAIFLIVRSLSAGVLDEVVVLGYLTTRLRQLRLPALLIGLISILVRAQISRRIPDMLSSARPVRAGYDGVLFQDAAVASGHPGAHRGRRNR